MLKINLRDAQCLIKIRRKVEHAIEAADAACKAHKAHQTPLGMVYVLGWPEPVPVFPRQYSDCYPDSIGPNTSYRKLPKAVVLDAMDAMCLAQGQTVHKVFGVEPVKRRIIDRRPAVQRLKAVHAAA